MRQLAGKSPLCDTRRSARIAAKRSGNATDDAGAKARPVLEPHPRLGDDAENAFGADDEPLGRGAGARARQPPRLEHALGRHHAHALDEIVDVRVERGEVPARARRDPAAQGRILEALREMAQRQAVRLQLRLDRRAEGAAFDAGGARGAIHFEDAAHAAEVDREDAALPLGRAARLDPADDARSGAERHDRRVRAARPIEQRGDICLAASDRPPRRARRHNRPQGRAHSRDRPCRRCARRGRRARSSTSAASEAGGARRGGASFRSSRRGGCRSSKRSTPNRSRMRASRNSCSSASSPSPSRPQPKCFSRAAMIRRISQRRRPVTPGLTPARGRGHVGPSRATGCKAPIPPRSPIPGRGPASARRPTPRNRRATPTRATGS